MIAKALPAVEKLPKHALQHFLEPERVLMFRVPWTNLAGEYCVNRGYRVQFSSLLGPYQGGVTFGPEVDQEFVYAKALQQTVANAASGRQLGGAWGGSDFDPKGKTDAELMAFVQSFATAMQRGVGQFTDIIQGGREAGLLFGQMKKLADSYAAVVVQSADATLLTQLASGKHKSTSILGFNAEAIAICRALQATEYAVRSVTYGAKTVVQLGGFKPEQVDQLEKNVKSGDKISDYKSNTSEFYEGDIQFNAAKQERFIICGNVSIEIVKKLASFGAGVVVATIPISNEMTAEVIKQVTFCSHEVIMAVATSSFASKLTQLAVRMDAPENKQEQIDEATKLVLKQCKNVAAQFGRDDDLQFGLLGFAVQKLAEAAADQGWV